MAKQRKIQNKIKEQRTIEAVGNDMMGAGGKLGTIVKYLGDPIIAHGGGFYDVNEFDYFWREDEEETQELPTLGEESINEIGYSFDGLSRGFNLFIKYDFFEKRLYAQFKGYIVYEEIAGDLEAYAPFEEWEKIVDYLFGIAKKRKKEVKKQHIETMEEEAKKESVSLLQKLRMRWGI